MKVFPVLNSGGESVPWNAVEPHRQQARRNHWKTLEELADVGGIGWKALYYTLTDSEFPLVQHEQVDYRRLVLDLVEAKKCHC